MQAGDLIDDRFEIERFAGSGGMGTVYRARDRASGNPVALKLVGGARDAPRFERESRVLAELDHPHIVRYVHHGVAADGGLYLAMEWLDGEDLAERLSRGALLVAESVALASRVAGALARAHARGIVHRDIKPSNLFLGPSSVDGVKILDFGIARHLRAGRHTTRTGATVGTPGYMAPEQARGQRDVDARADVFSLGCVLFECLTGRPTFTGETVMALLAKILLEEPPRVSDDLAGVAIELDDLVARMLCKDPAGRPVDGRAVAMALEALPKMEGEALRRPRTAPALTSGERRVSSVLMIAGETSGTREGDAEASSAASATTGTSGTSATCAAAGTLLSGHAARWGGNVEPLADGALVVTFTHVTAPTDQAASAARCALATQKAAPHLAMAIATGRGDASDRVPLGEAIDRASRLLRACARAASPSAPVVVDEVTAALLDGRFDLADEGGRRVLGAERDDDAVTRTLVGKPTPMVGRDRELQGLEALIEECFAEPVARAAIVTAPAGFGKSRLRHELLLRVRRRPENVEIWTARGDPIGMGSAFGLIAPMLRRAAGILDGEPLEARRAKLRARVSARLHGAKAERVGEFLGELIGTSLSEQPSMELRQARAEPVTMGDQMRRAWEDLLAAECAARPLLLIMEDLHWGDASSIAFVDLALKNLADAPLVVIAFARPEVNERFPRLWASRDAQVIALGALVPKAGARLARAVLGDAVDDATIARLVARAEGNAFYLEELIRATADGKGEDVPDTVIGMVSARLLELEPEARRILRAASVLGSTFWTGGVSALLGGDERAERAFGWLGALADMELIGRHAGGKFPGETEYSFRHGLVREAAYAMLTGDDKALGHRLAGAWLEAAGESDAMVLGEHFERGDEPLRAAPWYRRAAEQALEGHDFAGAIERAERAARCGVAGPALGALRLLQAVAHKWRGDNPEGERAARAAMALLPEGSSQWADAAGEAATASGKLGHYERVLELTRILLARLPDGATGALAVALARGATQLDYAGQLKASAEIFDALCAVTDPAIRADPATWAQVDLALAMHSLCLGDLGGASDHMQKVHAAQEATGNRRAALLCLSNWAYMRGELGDYVEAERMLREAAEGADRMGLESVGAGAWSNLGLLLAHEGRIEEAERVERAAIEAYRVQGHVRMEGSSRLYLARILALAGDPAGAEREVGPALSLLELSPPLRAYALAVLANALLGQGRTGEALAPATEGRALLAELGTIDDGEAFVRLVHAEALDAAGDGAGAREAIAAARRALYEKADRIQSPSLRQSFLERAHDSVRTLERAKTWLG